MLIQIIQLKKTFYDILSQAKTLEDLEKLKINFLGRHGKLTLFLRDISIYPKTERPSIGRQANQLKQAIEAEIEERVSELKKRKIEEALKKERIDVTLPAIKVPDGHLHPITKVARSIGEIFSSLGFEIVEGLEMESEYYNFDALNIPKEHPARDMWDTFWLKEPKTPIPTGRQENSKLKTQNLLLRTHTSPMQVRYMETHQPPFRIIVPGKCFRHEATDASHEHTFYQVEGLMVGKKVTLVNLKAVLEEFVKSFFGHDVKMRWRPGYFPFVEPGFEMDIACRVCKGKGCSVCKKTGWVEVVPCGMVHPNVFKAVKYDSQEWQGFAFGMGLDRIAMMKYRINDIRLFHSGDLRFLKQF